jgi:hypothetical protein
MTEFMFLIRNIGDGKAELSPAVHKEFLQACQIYIDMLKKDGRLIAAQPLIREGTVLSKLEGAWKETPVDPNKLVQVGYYHILAKDLDEAIALAKGNPEFAYGTTASIEVRPLKMKEQSTGFVYPKTAFD